MHFQNIITKLLIDFRSMSYQINHSGMFFLDIFSHSISYPLLASVNFLLFPFCCLSNTLFSFASFLSCAFFLLFQISNATGSVINSTLLYVFHGSFVCCLWNNQELIQHFLWSESGIVRLYIRRNHTWGSSDFCTWCNWWHRDGYTRAESRGRCCRHISSIRRERLTFGTFSRWVVHNFNHAEYADHLYYNYFKPFFELLFVLAWMRHQTFGAPLKEYEADSWWRYQSFSWKVCLVFVFVAILQLHCFLENLNRKQSVSAISSGHFSSNMQFDNRSCLTEV